MIDSSKLPYWFKSQLTHSYTWENIVPYLIYLSRDGRAVINSYLRKYPERDIVQVAETWKDQISRMNNFYDQFPNKKTKVKYEDLAMHPERVIKSICHFADIQYEKEMLRYWKHEHHPIYGNLGTYSLVFKYREKFGDNASKHCQEINSGNKYFVEKYYEQVGLAIKLDMRWVDELSAHQIETFDSIAGDINAPFVSDPGYSS